ncbi:MAG: LytTR family DNA-binding domain-containing protein [Cellulophaga sp.]
MKLNIIIVDDEQPARRLLENYVSKIEYLHLLGSFKSPLAALSILNEQKIDIILLDIRMPEISGLEFLATLKWSPAIILTTAYREYALDGYEHNVTDYLLKPIEFTRFLKAINKVKTNNRTSNIITNQIKEEKQLEHIYLKHNRKEYKIALDSILYIEGENEYVKYHLKNKENLLVYASLKNIEEKLLPSKFCRIHRSYIINLDAIDFLEGNRVTIQGQKLPISKTYKDFFKKSFKRN